MTPSDLAAPLFTERDFRNALGQFATGVTVVTTRAADGRPLGVTVSSFNAVSLAPPLVLWSMGHNASLLAEFRACSHYAIHVLSASQQHLARQFSTRNIDRFADVQWAPNDHGVPLLAGAAATFECRSRSLYDEGDHVILVGAVEACQHLEGESPLLYHAGRMHTDHGL